MSRSIIKRQGQHKVDAIITQTPRTRILDILEDFILNISQCPKKCILLGFYMTQSGF